ncbi:MAG: phosphonate ABC transporter ATP-binding protein [Rubrimonas sp.]|uniref:phosphonate ABC transporter ATP-binding protein n=1 Tax=Rubrimonas sp. TaxID=2036015 RepID=UPI002FDE9218
MLELQALTKRFGADAPAVSDVSLAIPNGQMVGVIGRSGAGKSTLLRMINRLVEPSAGRILHDGVDVTALRGRALLRWRRACAMIFQQFGLVKRRSVLANVLMGRLNAQPTITSLLGIYPVEDRALAVEALDRLDMADFALHRADQLSGGQQQRVAIARALAQAPRLILADEPIASLDPRAATMVMDTLARINREDGITVICNLHTLDAARAYCDRIIGMLHGRVVHDGPPGSLDPARLRAIYGLGPEAEGAAAAPPGPHG